MKQVFFNYILKILMTIGGFLFVSCGAKFADLNKNSNGFCILFIPNSKKNEKIYKREKEYWILLG